MEIFQSLQCINISICVLPPPSLTVMWYWKSFYLFLISTVREATLLHQSDLCIGLSLNLLFSSFSPVEVEQSCHLSPCHDSEEEIRKILWLPARKLDISIHHVWWQPDSHNVHSWFACLNDFFLQRSHFTLLSSEMSDVTLGNSPVIKIYFMVHWRR